MITGQETLGISANDMVKVAGRVVKGMCAEGQHSNVAQAIKHNYPHGDNKNKFLKSAAKYCMARPLVAAAGMQTFFQSGARPSTGVCAQRKPKQSTISSWCPLVVLQDLNLHTKTHCQPPKLFWNNGVFTARTPTATYSQYVRTVSFVPPPL